jgi:hypothetical protein
MVGTPAIVEKPKFSASLDGLWASYIDWRTGKRVQGNMHKHAKAEVPVDQRTGSITLALIGGKGNYTLKYYVNGYFLINVATCGENMSNIQLTHEARDSGWR